MKKYALGFIALLVIALLTPGLGQAATFGTDLWATLYNYNFSTQSTVDSNNRLKAIESFSDGESAFAHYLIGAASAQEIVYTAPFNTAGYKTIAVTCFTSTAGGGIGYATPVLTMSGAAAYLVDVWGRPGKDDLWDTSVKNIYTGANTITGAAGGAVAKGLLYGNAAATLADGTGAITTTATPYYIPMTFRTAANAGTLGTKIWDTGGAYGAIIMSASAYGVSAGACATTHIMIRVSK